ncbi:alpha-ketoglutarate-dependent dioxygenase AlkB [Actinocorallia sp. B10E7]|uniref:alpha-ketoglutarate-dependent dioxygenase AlkB n=1 Tax=Actinocorallia sp. B10E7 TaxID=3153558 RepID=UPI00325C92F0
MIFQGSLLDCGGETRPGPLGGTVHRTPLAHGAWIDLRPAWVSGADDLFQALVHAVPWRAEKRVMYDKLIDVPRLTAFYGEDASLPHPALSVLRDALSAHYASELGEPFRTAGLCLYRDGGDGVAWHGDRIGRGRTEDTMVAIVSLGSPRHLLLRPAADGGPTLRHALGHGDLLVMGGSCQRTWLHSIPKTAAARGPRISVQFRPRGVR